MSTNTNTIIVKINMACNKCDFVEARRLVNNNISKLSESKYYRQLCDDAKVLIKHMIDSSTNGQKPLTRLELLTLDSINKDCRSFDVASLKRTLKNSVGLVNRPDAFAMLSEDAKGLLNTMGAILGMEKEKEEVVN